VVPPSLVLIVLAEQLEVSLVDIYRGALLPSIMLVTFYMLYIFVLTAWKPHWAPPIDDTGWIGSVDWRSRLRVFLDGALPIGLVLCVLGSIAYGVATPSEAGAIGVTTALTLALAKRRLKLAGLKQALVAAGVLCCGVVFLLIGASFFTLVFRGLDGHLMIEALFQHIPAGQIGFVLTVNAVVFGLAFFLDFFEIAFIVLPLIAPIAHAAGVDVVWLAVLLAINLQTSFMHPPFGIALYNLRSVTPASIKTVSIYWGAVPFVLIQALTVVLLILFPALVLRNPAPPHTGRELQLELPPLVFPESGLR